MTYRSIDLQVSIPKTQEHGTQQSQMNQKPIVDQMQLADHAAKQTERLRAKNSEIAQSSKLSVNDERRRESGSSRKRANKGEAGHGAEEASEKAEPSAHPYKGKHIDISL